MQYAMYILISALIFFSDVSACKRDIESEVSYPVAANPIDEEIDRLLYMSEDSLFTGDFRDGLFCVERVETLLPLTNDVNDYRRLRYLFDKALLVTCDEGVSDNSRYQFEQFGALLGTKGCKAVFVNSQPDLFDQNGHWPIVGDEPVSVGECLSRVDSLQSKLERTCSFLSLSPRLQLAVQSAIALMGDTAKLCCTKKGFWKTCIQPVVDAWKRTEIFGIPPDPYWD